MYIKAKVMTIAKCTDNKLQKLRSWRATKSCPEMLDSGAGIVLAAESAPAATTKAGMPAGIFGNFSGVSKGVSNSFSMEIEMGRFQTMMRSALVQCMELDETVSEALVAIAGTRQTSGIPSGT